MRSVESFEKIFLYPKAVDMRKQINGLAQIVESSSALKLFSPSLFLFTNRHRRLIKALYWANTGFCLWMMKLEENRFPWPKSTDKHLLISPEQFNWLIRGVDFRKIKPHQSLEYERFS